MRSDWGMSFNPAVALSMIRDQYRVLASDYNKLTGRSLVDDEDLLARVEDLAGVEELTVSADEAMTALYRQGTRVALVDDDDTALIEHAYFDFTARVDDALSAVGVRRSEEEVEGDG